MSRSPKSDVDLYGVNGAAAYLGLSPNTIRALATRYRESEGADGLRFWQEVPARQQDGAVIHGSPLVFKRAWLDAYRRKHPAPQKRQQQTERQYVVLNHFRRKGVPTPAIPPPTEAEVEALVERGWLEHTDQGVILSLWGVRALSARRHKAKRKGKRSQPDGKSR